MKRAFHILVGSQQSSLRYPNLPHASELAWCFIAKKARQNTVVRQNWLTHRFIRRHFKKEVYLENGFELVAKAANVSQGELEFFAFVEDEEFEKLGMKIAHWSYFEDWNPYYNYLVAKEHCGLVEESETNPGTFTNYAQNDQDLYSLHVYLMYLKFGFGRATQDAGIDIRRGAMSRSQAINLVRAYDGQYPKSTFRLISTISR